MGILNTTLLWTSDFLLKIKLSENVFLSLKLFLKFYRKWYMSVLHITLYFASTFNNLLISKLFKVHLKTTKINKHKTLNQTSGNQCKPVCFHLINTSYVHFKI